MKYYLAIDIGASSGRHIIGYEKDGEILTDEVYRFENGMDNDNGRLIGHTTDGIGYMMAAKDAGQPLQQYVLQAVRERMERDEK